MWDHILTWHTSVWKLIISASRFSSWHQLIIYDNSSLQYSHTHTDMPKMILKQQRRWHSCFNRNKIKGTHNFVACRLCVVLPTKILFKLQIQYTYINGILCPFTSLRFYCYVSRSCSHRTYKIYQSVRIKAQICHIWT